VGGFFFCFALLEGISEEESTLVLAPGLLLLPLPLLLLVLLPLFDPDPEVEVADDDEAAAAAAFAIDLRWIILDRSSVLSLPSSTGSCTSALFLAGDTGDRFTGCGIRMEGVRFRDGDILLLRPRGDNTLILLGGVVLLFRSDIDLALAAVNGMRCQVCFSSGSSLVPEPSLVAASFASTMSARFSASSSFLLSPSRS
jgi:hypothetical protein